MKSVVELLKRSVVNPDSTDQELNTSLHLAVMIGDTIIVKNVLGLGASVNFVNIDRETPLHKAAMGTNSEIVNILLERGASTDIQNKKGYSPFHIAVSKGYKQILDLMLDAGPRINLRTNTGETALHIAASHHNCILAEMLLDRGALVNARTKNGSTALHMAVILLDLTMTELLLERGANVNIPNSEGQTALHFASEQWNCRLFKLLLNGSDRVLINTQNRKGDTALHIATRNADSMIVDLLLARGAMINVKDNAGMTAIDCAVANGHTFLVQKLINSGATVHVDSVIVDKSEDIFTKSTRNIVIEHMVRMETALEFEKVNNFESRFKNLKQDLRKACKEELQMIKKTNILNNFELSDFFDNPAVSYNSPPYKHFSDLFNSVEVLNKFPNFALLFKIALINIKRRFSYLIRARYFFLVLCKFKKFNFTLPTICIRKILICLSDTELENLIVCSENIIRDSLIL
ncbi:ankyrin-3-like [Homalodisca vitripennis]|uniref:ankyrin-3-like n=1 Tax=Homalodisca vitripennis TaxID=197043 RepID=UPI001EEA6AFD|nr:ankyrin-3-like [Homalodisca vitripennis]XP_046660528.1 ankyrin-3-like [Homalodisca vitripennis]XP_046660529.1 ankyrin-3-like [Homalodisca vitripennis]